MKKGILKAIMVLVLQGLFFFVPLLSVSPVMAQADYFKTNGGIPDIPSYTTTARNGITAETGMTIFNSTESQIEVYDGSEWKAIATVGSGDGDWTVSGNNMYSAVSGNIGIGETNPTTALQVNGVVSLSDINDMDENSSDETLATKYYVDSQEAIMEYMTIGPGTHSSLDISNKGVIFLNNTSSINIQTLANGKEGQTIRFVVLNSGHTSYLRNNYGTPMPTESIQPIYTHSGGDITWTKRGGALLICKNNVWYAIATAY